MSAATTICDPIVQGKTSMDAATTMELCLSKTGLRQVSMHEYVPRYAN